MRLERFIIPHGPAAPMDQAPLADQRVGMASFKGRINRCQ
jgi:hypothetical protein